MRRFLCPLILASLLGTGACLPVDLTPEGPQQIPSLLEPNGNSPGDPHRLPTTPSTSPSQPAEPTPTVAPPPVSPFPTPAPVVPLSALTETAVLHRVDGLPGHDRWQITETPYGATGARWSPTESFLQLDVINRWWSGLWGFEVSNVILDWKSGKATAVGNQTAQNSPERPFWLPNDEQILYQAGDSIWISKPDGSEKRLLAMVSNPEHRLPSLALSPDKRQLAYIDWHPEGVDLWLLDLNIGGEPIHLATIPADHAKSFSWSPGSDQAVLFSYSRNITK